MTISDVEAYISLIVARLQQLDLERIILFGSYADGTATEDSDVDLMVVLDREDFPGSHREKNDLYLGVSRIIRDIRQQVPVQLIVHTKATHRKFIELDSMFAKEVLQKGKVLYEADH